MTRTALYLRVSNPYGDEKDEDIDGLDVQLDACTQYALRRGLNFAPDDIYTDTITGTTEQRAGFGKLLTNASRYSDVILYDAIRLARHPKAGYALLETLQNAGLNVHTVHDGMLDLTNDTGAVNFGMRMVFADFERRRIIQRLTDGKIVKVKGKPHLGIPGQPLVTLRKYGWKNGKIHPTEAGWVRWMFERSLEVGQYGIARELQQLGVPSPTGRDAWDPTVIHDMLRDPAYRGEWVFGRDRRGRKRVMKESYSAPCPPIVSEELWHAAQRAMDARRTGQGRRGTRTDAFPLQGRIYCAECGRAMTGHHERARRHYYYTCGDKRHTPARRLGCAHGTYYRVDAIHQPLVAFLRDLTLDTTDLTPYLPQREGGVQDVTPLLADIKQRRKRIAEAYENGVDSLAEYREKKARLDLQEQAILNTPRETRVTVRPEQLRAALRDAVSAENLHVTAVRLGLRVLVAPGGVLRVEFDPVI